MEFADRLKTLRGHLGLNQVQLAKETGISKSYIATVESGKQKPSYDFIMKILHKFDISADWLLLGRGRMLLAENILEETDYKDIYKFFTTASDDDIKAVITVIDRLKK